MYYKKNMNILYLLFFIFKILKYFNVSIFINILNNENFKYKKNYYVINYLISLLNNLYILFCFNFYHLL